MESNESNDGGITKEVVETKNNQKIVKKPSYEELLQKNEELLEKLGKFENVCNTLEKKNLELQLYSDQSFVSFLKKAIDKPESTDFLKETVNSIRDYFDSSTKYKKELREKHASHALWKTIIMTSFFVVILLATVFLTYVGKLDSSLTFLLGTFTGHYITYVSKRDSNNEDR
ncbi:hypothetical protein [Methanosarcina sp. 2.H.A.1B.4]|uniref:hypothetical protein n=1 Tax=Methanosarcina sp. 2.H.A.1B.4 TaxID=1483600 RepID=UPI0006220B7B|nr:hypothetical protein [Methanosarcina sp. 2.H.A.1B.4]KKG09809.1 hypothetical protein EO92_13710 [Methanosarcina sp. 2.H.A.1B.4]